MVFFYQIRGGPCRGELSHLTLRQEDVICYVGRDKYENEELIAHGWPGDVWFHCDGVSSAHVYFRLNYDVAAAFHGNDVVPLSGAIPMDCLPDSSVQDMMQIVKHNSIEGSKMASTRIVWTPHSNLRKNFDMAAGQVTYHDTKLCRYGRCHKDRQRIKALEKTKSIDHTDMDLYQIKKDNERALIERRKQHKKSMARIGGGKKPAEEDGMYDPIESDRKLTLMKQTRQGDEQSGIDKGVAALEGLALGDRVVYHGPTSHNGGNGRGPGAVHNVDNDVEDLPVWKQEYKQDEQDYNDDMALFLLERGYPRSSVDEILKNARPKTNVEALSKLWNALDGNDGATKPSEVDEEELLATRQEEREVLDAIYGEDMDWFSTIEEGTEAAPEDARYLLDSSVLITTYTAPDRYISQDDPPPELRLEIYTSLTHYPLDGSPPILAILGGGIPKEYLHKLTQQLRQEALEKAAEEGPGSPLLFSLITHFTEICEIVVEEEGAASAKAQQEARQARLKALREQEKAAMLAESNDDSTASNKLPTKFASEEARRAYAASVIAQNANGLPKSDLKTTSKAKGREYYDKGISNKDLIDDLFGL